MIDYFVCPYCKKGTKFRKVEEGSIPILPYQRRADPYLEKQEWILICTQCGKEISWKEVREKCRKEAVP